MATQQIVSPAVSQSKLAVVPFPAPQAVTQLELAAFCSIRSRLHQLQQQVEAAEASIKSRLESGCEIEAGDHTAVLKESFRQVVDVAPDSRVTGSDARARGEPPFRSTRR